MAGGWRMAERGRVAGATDHRGIVRQWLAVGTGGAAMIGAGIALGMHPGDRKSVV